ncbi:MAG: hypothetical protein ACXABY_29675, partial [Candidatus Thorarchaeota archaeon]
MGHTRVEHSQGDALQGACVYKAVPEGGRGMRLKNVRITPTGADWSADVAVYIYDCFTGIGSNLVSSGDFVPTLTTAYTSDFTADADGWAANSGGDLAVAFNQTIGGVTGCLKVSSAAGSDFEIHRTPAARTAATHYKLVFDYYTAAFAADTGYLGFGEGGACTTNASTVLHATGHNLLIVADSAWHTSQELFTWDGADTNLDLALFTAKNGQVQDVIAAGESIYFKNMVLSTISNQSDWTFAVDETEIGWDYFDELMTQIGAPGNGQTATQAIGNT